MDPQPVAFETKLCTSDEAAVRVTGLMRPLVFTNGCFDVLHPSAACRGGTQTTTS